MTDTDTGREGQLVLEWQQQLAEEFKKPYMHSLKQFLLEEKKAGKEVYPKSSEMFTALNWTPFSKVKVVVLGQDPYHGEGQAHGLSFSVKPGVSPPPSLQNIFKELRADLGVEPPSHGFLKSWAEQGVLMLNAVLTVEKAQPGSHQKKGWEAFTDCIIERLNSQREGLIFILWGSQAQKKGSIVDETRHLVLRDPHPSPLSAYRGFLGSRPFSQVNRYLISRNEVPISWEVPELQ